MLVSAVALVAACPDPFQRPGVHVTSAAARACDLVFDVGQAEVREVAFVESAMGAHFRRGKRLAVSVISRADQPFDAGFVRVMLPGEATPVLLSATCYDGTGERLATAGVAQVTR